MEITVDGKTDLVDIDTSASDILSICLDIEKKLNKCGRIPYAFRLGDITYNRDEINSLDKTSASDYSSLSIESLTFNEFSKNTLREFILNIPAMIETIEQMLEKPDQGNMSDAGKLIGNISEIWTLFNNTTMNLEQLNELNLREIRSSEESVFDNITLGGFQLKRIKAAIENDDVSSVIEIVKDEMLPLFRRWESHLENICSELSE